MGRSTHKYMAARKRKTTPKYSLKERLAAYAIGFASLASTPGMASCTEAYSTPVFESFNQRSSIVAVSYRNELQDEQVENEIKAVKVVQPAVVKVASADASSDAIWDKLARLESGGNWNANTGNGYFGGLQFSLPTWRSVGGNGLPSEASREEQIVRAKILQAQSGWGQWPACARTLGLI